MIHGVEITDQHSTSSGKAVAKRTYTTPVGSVSTTEIHDLIEWYEVGLDKATLARFSFWVPPEGRAEFEAAYEHQVAPPCLLGTL